MMYNISGRKRAAIFERDALNAVSVLTKIARKKPQFSKLFSLNILGYYNIFACSVVRSRNFVPYCSKDSVSIMASFMNGHCHSDVLRFVWVITLPCSLCASSRIKTPLYRRFGNFSYKAGVVKMWLNDPQTCHIKLRLNRP